MRPELLKPDFSGALPTEAICECLPGWSGTGWSGWFRSR